MSIQKPITGMSLLVVDYLSEIWECLGLYVFNIIGSTSVFECVGFLSVGQYRIQEFITIWKSNFEYEFFE